MPSSIRVSQRVSCGVSQSVSQDTPLAPRGCPSSDIDGEAAHSLEDVSESHAGEGESRDLPATERRRGPGPYLVKSGRHYIFQLRVPRTLGGGRGSRPVRISLGSVPHASARATADKLAAVARDLFTRLHEQKKSRSMTDETERDQEPDATGASEPREADLTALKMLAAFRTVIATKASEGAKHPDSPFARLSAISAEERKKENGEAYNALLVDHADMLRKPYLKAAEKALNRAVNEGVAGASNASQIDWNRLTVYPNEMPDAGERSFAASAEATTAGAPSTSVAATTALSTTTVEAPLPPQPSAALASKADPAPVATREETDDEADDDTPAFERDRRTIKRPKSRKPLFSRLLRDKVAAYHAANGGHSKDAKTMEARANLFIELIGDHPVDTYTGTDVQAFIHLISRWPADTNVRKNGMTAWELLELNKDLFHKPLSLKAMREGYVANIRTIMNSQTMNYDYKPPLAGYDFWYPATAAMPQSAEPLSKAQISSVFAAGVEHQVFDEAALPLLGHLTGRRLGLMVHLKGTDFREKYPGVFVAQTSNIQTVNGQWRRVPIKSNASTTFFVLHQFLVETGFVDFAMSLGDEFLFPGLMRLADPSKSAGSYMTRLFNRAGIKTGEHRDVFHSLRGGNIEDMRDHKIDPRDRKLQAGHQLGSDDHELYGFRAISETRGRELARLPLDPEIDFSPFIGLDWSQMNRDSRKRGRSRKKPGKGPTSNSPKR